MTKNEYRKLHKWMRDTYGNAFKCENTECTKISKTYDWALIKGKEYTYERSNFFQMCRSCHTKYDMTLETRKKISDCLTGRKRPDVSIQMKGNQYARKYQKIGCNFCKIKFYPRNYKRRFCSKSCAMKHRHNQKNYDPTTTSKLP